MPSNCNDVSCFQQIFEKNLEFTAEGWVFSLFCELTAFWLLIFVSTEPSRSILLIDRSESRFESHAGGKITKTLKKRCKFSRFVDFQLNQIQNCSVQIKKMRNWIFSLQLKKKLLLPNVYRQC